MVKQEKEEIKIPHNIVMEQRSKLILSGVTEVVTFETDNVALKTTMGNLCIKGSDMRMDSYNSTTYDLEIGGNIFAIVYTNDSAGKEGFFSRIFK